MIFEHWAFDLRFWIIRSLKNWWPMGKSSVSTTWEKRQRKILRPKLRFEAVQVWPVTRKSSMKRKIYFVLLNAIGAQSSNDNIWMNFREQDLHRDVFIFNFQGFRIGISDRLEHMMNNMTKLSFWRGRIWTRHWWFKWYRHVKCIRNTPDFSSQL